MLPRQRPRSMCGGNGRDHKSLNWESDLPFKQELVDCETSGMDQGCEGSLMDDAFEFIIQNNGLATEANYPYKGVDGNCNSRESSRSYC
ncbi:hypothetical protein GH714_042060 [Hevea brasiliensis]|uniref:Peptidase C1A papain C-terminal domain-containing protein n=1 Tax=Hevea brasiliensis TaxID=3981 RepID=A0A6A6MY17_HEVBR|nr:hypothetical protein GH714_042060 [Hevea brasiliensis]